MRIGLIAMSGVRVKSAELAELGVTLPGFIGLREQMERSPHPELHRADSLNAGNRFMPSENR